MKKKNSIFLFLHFTWEQICKIKGMHWMHCVHCHFPTWTCRETSPVAQGHASLSGKTLIKRYGRVLYIFLNTTIIIKSDHQQSPACVWILGFIKNQSYCIFNHGSLHCKVMVMLDDLCCARLHMYVRISSCQHLYLWSGSCFWFLDSTLMSWTDMCELWCQKMWQKVVVKLFWWWVPNVVYHLIIIIIRLYCICIWYRLNSLTIIKTKT